MDYDEINITIRLKGELYSIPCNLAITPDGDKLVIVFKQERVGGVRELQQRLIESGKRNE